MRVLSVRDCVPFQTTWSPSPAAPTVCVPSHSAAHASLRRLRCRKRVESGVRCALGHTAAGSEERKTRVFWWGQRELSIGWCRCVATRANGSKCSVYAAKLKIENYLGDLVVCNTRVLLGDKKESDSTRSTWMRTTELAPSALLFWAMSSRASRPLASTPTLSSHSRTTLTTQCRCTASTHCDSSRSRASNSRTRFISCSAENCCSSIDYNEDTGTSEIVSLNTSGWQLTRRRVLLDSNANVDVDEWCLAGNQLVICDRNLKVTCSSTRSSERSSRVLCGLIRYSTTLSDSTQTFSLYLK